MIVNKQSEKFYFWKKISQSCENQLIHTPGWMNSTWPHAPWRNQSTRFPTIKMLKFFSARGCWLSEAHQRAKSDQVASSLCKQTNPATCTAWSTWRTWPSSGSSRWQSRSLPSAGCARRTRCPCSKVAAPSSWSFDPLSTLTQSKMLGRSTSILLYTLSNPEIPCFSFNGTLSPDSG